MLDGSSFLSSTYQLMKQNLSPSQSSRKLIKPTILRSSEHPISDEILPLEIVWILSRLRWNGFLAYIVGGGVRDLLLGRIPKDFDIGTDATPEEIHRLFYNSRIIGHRFRLVHIYFRDGHFVEVSTFRRDPPSKKKTKWLTKNNNFFGTPAEDAWRRDITINGLFYDSQTGNIIDYVGGLEDLQRKVIRTIGEPDQKFAEDPVRMIRAIRHSARLELDIEPLTWNAIHRHAPKIKKCSTTRVREEFFKELRSGHAEASFRLFYKSGLLKGWLPSLAHWLKDKTKNPFSNFHCRFGRYIRSDWAEKTAIWKRLRVADKQIQQGRSFDDLILLGLLLFPIIWEQLAPFCQIKQKTSHLWNNAFEKKLTPLISELHLLPKQRDLFFQFSHTYWKLHLFSIQPSLIQALQRSPLLKEALTLLKMEFISHEIPPTEWQKFQYTFGARYNSL